MIEKIAGWFKGFEIRGVVSFIGGVLIAVILSYHGFDGLDAILVIAGVFLIALGVSSR